MYLVDIYVSHQTGSTNCRTSTGSTNCRTTTNRTSVTTHIRQYVWVHLVAASENVQTLWWKLKKTTKKCLCGLMDKAYDF
jgi:hypothetical protein